MYIEGSLWTGKESTEHQGRNHEVADEESQWASERMGLQEDTRVVRVQVGQEKAAVTPVLAATTKTYHAYPHRRSPGSTDGFLVGEGEGYAVLRDASLAM